MRSHPKFRLLGTTPGIVDGEHARKMGASRLLFDYLVARQYDGGIDGAVNYGRPLTVDQIRAEIPNAPDARTIRRYVSRLRAGGYIRTHRTYLHGLRFWILNQKKFQLSLPFRSRPELVTTGSTNPVQNPVQMLMIPSDIPKTERTDVSATAGVSGQPCPEKSLELESIKERIRTASGKIARLRLALAMDDGLPDRRVDRDATLEEIRLLELQIDQAFDDSRNPNPPDRQNRTSTAPATSPAEPQPRFEDALRLEREDGEGRRAFVAALRKIADGRAI